MHYKEKLFDVKDPERWSANLCDWMYPLGIVDLVMAGEEVYDLEKMKGGLLIAPSEDLEIPTATKVLRTLAPHTLNGSICSTASELLRSIKKDSWNDDYELRALDLLKHVDILGVFQIEGLVKDEITDLDRWVAIRGAIPERFTVLFGSSWKKFKVTVNAYKGRIMEVKGKKS